MVNDLTGRINGNTTWVGRYADESRGKWEGEFKTALSNLITALGAARANRPHPGPGPPTDGDLFQIQLPRGKGDRLPTGRGYLVAGGEVELTPVARP